MNKVGSIKFLVITISMMILLTACISGQSMQSSKETRLDSILVFPTTPIIDETITSETQVKAIKYGANVLDNIVKDFFTNNNKIELLSREQQDALSNNYNLTRHKQALAIGKQLNKEAVLTSSLIRYRERSGKNYAVDSPASVEFEYRLMLTNTGETLCAGSFNETQQSITDNLLNLKKAIQRSGQWVTAEQLAREGVTEKFSNCSLLIKK